ncbi:unnamed protein product [Orchesella dallaii]|uniref:Ionotropic receptor n=1 Tax=Orchesella dallaii TaxID=48710 RepID=A0ABP1RHH2_9HEXA
MATNTKILLFLSGLSLTRLSSTLNVATYCKSNPLQQMFPRIFSEPENFTVSLYNIKFCRTLENSRDYVSYTIFYPWYQQQLNRPVHRYTQPYTIILSVIFRGIQSFQTHLEYIYNIRSIFVIFYKSAAVTDPSALIYQSDVRALPTIKLFVDVNNYNNKTKTFHVDCNGFCIEKHMKFDPEASDKMLSVLEYHKSLFWDGNGKPVNTTVKTLSLAFFPSFRKNPLKCLARIMDHRADIRRSYLCGSLIMVIGHLAQAHNLTINLHDYYNTSHAKFPDYSGDYLFINGPYRVANRKKSFIRLTSYVLALQDSSKVIYCKAKKVHTLFTVQYFVWVECFSAELVATWFILHLLACIVAMNYSKSTTIIILLRMFLEKVMQLLLLAIGEIAIPLRKSIYICIAIVGLLNAWFYQNTITSLVTVATPDYPMKNLRELIHKDYKILFKKTEIHANFRNQFRFLKIEDRINSSFIETNTSLTTKVIAQYYRQNNKMAVLVREANSERLKQKIQNDITKYVKFSDTKCYVISESFMPGFYYWQIYTNNLPWLKISMSRMTNAGLAIFWENRYKRLDDVMSKFTIDVKKLSAPDVINVQKFLSVLIFCGSLYMLSFAVLLAERITNRNKAFKAAKSSTHLILVKATSPIKTNK